MRLKNTGILALMAAGTLSLSTVGFASNAVNMPPAALQTSAVIAQRLTLAEAEGGGDVTTKELDRGTLIVTIVIFACLVLVLSKTAWKPIMAGLKSREEAIRESIEAAQRAKEDAERSTRELEARMAEVQRQASQQLTQAKADAQLLADSIRKQAEAEAVALKDRTLREIDGAKQQALSEINTHAAELGIAVARKILQRNVTVDDQQRLVDESLAEIAKQN